CVFFSFFFSSRRRHTRSKRDWSSDVCSSDLDTYLKIVAGHEIHLEFQLAYLRLLLHVVYFLLQFVLLSLLKKRTLMFHVISQCFEWCLAPFLVISRRCLDDRRV